MRVSVCRAADALQLQLLRWYARLKARARREVADRVLEQWPRLRRDPQQREEPKGDAAELAAAATGAGTAGDACVATAVESAGLRARLRLQEEGAADLAAANLRLRLELSELRDTQALLLRVHGQRLRAIETSLGLGLDRDRDRDRDQGEGGHG